MNASLKHPSTPSAGSTSPSEVDPELLSLPAPPSTRRATTMFLMAVTCVVAIAMAVALRSEVLYFFSGQTITDVGNAATLEPATLVTNSYVHVSGNPMVSQAVQYRRSLTGETFSVFPLAGQRAIYVHVPGDALEVPTTEYAGRLVTFRAMGTRLDGVRAHLAEAGQPVTPDSFVLLVDESPGATWWAVAFALVAALIVVVNGALLVRWFRPLPQAETR